MKGIERVSQIIKDCLKHVFPPSVECFMCEINCIKQAIECLNKNVDCTMKNTAEKERILLEILQQETDALKSEIQAIKSLQRELGEQLALQLDQQTALLQTINQNIVEEKKQTDCKIAAVVRRCNTLDSREKRLVQDKRLLEQIVLGKVPNFSSVSLELTNHCAYNCVFCPREQMTRARGIMTDESIRMVAQRLKAQANKNIVVWTDGMGEVMLLNEFFDKIRLIKSVMPNALPYVVTTLGYEKDDSYWDTFLQAGIKQVMISIFGYDRKTYQLLHGIDRYDLVKSNLNILIAKNRVLGSPVEIKVSVESFGKDFFSRFENFDYDNHVHLKEQFIDEIKDEPATMIFKRTIHNRGQAFHFAAPRTGARKCFIGSYPTRQEKLYVSWDLNILPCPMIFNDEIVFGNLKEQSLEEIYSSKIYKDFLDSLRTGALENYPSCQNCNM